ncbi:hypothetical protein BEP19_12375 [Ammoniphilus oxalaticus]|uniref:YwgA family protein n=1 Tax=Ammoniphilus oxalaticus TaxID=66863 RepID=A0A419SGV7_9BACL|nr:YwgA family protein [Ammoniphilus oxalaticus]RKD23019.1 hypothetical protein BEP19_12375 [Ammoniphilus oxalaticus]
MLQEHAKVLQLIKQAGEIVGRKKLQKIVYITQKLQFELNQRFQFHFFGPYSEELSLEIEELGELGFLQEKLEDKGNYRVYRYRITDKGEDFLAHVPAEVGNVTPIVNKLNRSTARFLELVSTVFYFEQLSRSEVEEKVFTLKAKSNYTTDEISEAYRWIEQLKTLSADCVR